MSTCALPALPAPRLALLPAAAAAVDVRPSEILRRWFDSLGDAARSKYSLAVRQFGSWAIGDDDAEAVLRLLVDAGRVGARQLALGWREHLFSQGRASATVAGYLSALVGVVSAARLCGLIDWHLEKVSPKIEAREDRSGPPRHEVEQLVAYLEEATDRFAVRDLAIVRLLHGAALRRNEVVSLRRCDVLLEHQDGPRVLARRKSRREREPMTIGTLAARSLRAHLEQRGDIGPTEPVFVRIHAVGEQPGPLSGEAVRQMLRSRAAQAGLRSTVRPHGLRHTAASHCARNAPLAALKRLGGWTTLTSPARYLDRDDTDRQLALAVVEV